MKINCGIYKIKNLINGKCYIGQSIHVEYRKNIHFSQLRNNNGHNQHLQNSYNKYGEENFEFSILLYCEQFELTRYESFFNDYYKKLNLSYNIRECVDSNKGLIISEEGKKRLRKFHKGKHLSEKTKELLRKANLGINSPRYGKKHSEKTKKEMSEIAKGKNNSFYGKHHSEKAKKRIGEFQTGRQRSEETRARMSKAKKRNSLSEETKRKIGKVNKGRHPSEETKRKISESLKKTLKNIKNNKAEDEI